MGRNVRPGLRNKNRRLAIDSCVSWSSLDAGNRSLLHLTLGIKGGFSIKIQKCFKEPRAGRARTQERLKERQKALRMSSPRAVSLLALGPPSLRDRR